MIYICNVGLSRESHTKNMYAKMRGRKCVGGITWPKHMYAQSQFWALWNLRFFFNPRSATIPENVNMLVGSLQIKIS